MRNPLFCLSLTALAASAVALEAEPPNPEREMQRQVQRDVQRDVERDVQRAMQQVQREVQRVVAEVPLQLALGEQALAFAGRELEGERVVKGAPYCATVVNENVQPLGDGNRIVRKQQSQVCRDGEGRTRREVQREGQPKVIYLNDPVAREAWVVYPEQKRVQRLRGTVHLQPAEMAQHEAAMQDWAERMREQAGRWREWAGRTAERARAVEAERLRSRASGEPGIVIEQEFTGPGEGERRRELRVLRASEMPAPPALPAPPAVPVPPTPPVLMFSPGLPREGGVTTALPARDIEGVKVTGERISWTIPAGKIGNEKPIVITREVWRSPELMLTVQSRDADPRSGEVNYRLENLKRGEPDAALMKPPADFTENRRAPRPAASGPTRAS